MRHDMTRDAYYRALPVEELDFTVSTWKILKRNRIRTVQELLSLTKKKNWASSRLHCGKKSTLEIASSLSDLNLAKTQEPLAGSGIPLRELARPLNRFAGTLLLCRKIPSADAVPDL